MAPPRIPANTARADPTTPADKENEATPDEAAPDEAAPEAAPVALPIVEDGPTTPPPLFAAPELVAVATAA